MEGTLALLIPVLGLSIGLVAVITGGLVKVYKARGRTDGGPAPEILTELEDLRAELQAVRAELSEVQERLDFTERLLAGGRGHPLPPAE
jgi:hypothetical protein